MLDAVPVVVARMGGQCGLEGVQRVVDGRVAVGVHRHLPSVGVSFGNQIDQPGGGDDLVPVDVGAVVVPLTETGRVPLDGPVGDELEGTDRQPLVAHTGTEGQRVCGLPTGEEAGTDPDRAVLYSLLVDGVHGLIHHQGVSHGRGTDLQAVVADGLSPSPHGRWVGERKDGPYGEVCCLLHASVGSARLLTLEVATFRVVDVIGDAGQGQHPVVGVTEVA